MRRLLLAWLLVAAGQTHAQNTITHYEYWFDRDDDDASRTLVEVTFPASVIDLLNQSPDARMLPVGPHRIHYRMRDARGRWSSVLHRDFRRLPDAPHHITGIEYWFDRNDADNDRRFLEAQPPASPVDLIRDIDVSALRAGPHRIHYRLKDNHGQWSSVLHRDFRRNHDAPHEVVMLRYWVGRTADPPMTEVPIPQPAQHIDILLDLEHCMHTLGDTTVFYQLKDNHGQWSSVVQRNINIDMVGVPARPVFVTTPGAVEQGSTYTFSVTPVPGASSYGWILRSGWSGSSNGPSIDVTIDAQTSPPDSIGVYAINACGTSDTTWYVILNVGARDTEGGGQVRLFPNPTTGQFTLELDGPAQVSLFDAAGRQVVAPQQVNSTRHTFDLGHTNPGLYTVRIVQDGRVVNRRLVVQH